MKQVPTKSRLTTILITENIVTQKQLDEAIAAQMNENKPLADILVDLGYLSEDKKLEVLSKLYRIPVVNLVGMKIPDEVLGLVPGKLLRKHIMIPVGFADKDSVNVAMADPMDFAALDDFAMSTGFSVVPAISSTHDIMLALDKYYGNAESLNAAEQYASEKKATETEEAADEESAEIENSPVVILVRSMIEQAARMRASDIHIEPMQSKVRIRYRIDGDLKEIVAYDLSLQPAIIARLKVIGGLDIAEKRIPQSGRITVEVDRKEYDIRLEVSPTVFGEEAVMRLALKQNLSRNKLELGLTEKDLPKFDHIFANPNGIILVTGPTGSGKSTTLYTALSELNTEDVKIITVEDPVEANIDGIMQIQTNTKAGLTFASALRSILRLDPDKILIGEIRDTETAQIAVQAAITGHLVVSTLHTNSASASISRLVNMGLPPYMVSDSVVGILAQRLVKRLCPHCKRKVLATETQKKMMLIPDEKLGEPLEIYEPVGCPECDDTGFRGRIAIYEIMEITPAIKKLIIEDASSEQIKNQAVSEGMSTLRMSAAECVMNGITDFKSMMRVSFEG